LTGLWDAKVDRVPILALTGQVDTQVLGPGAFQEIPTAKAFDAVAAWSQTVLVPENAKELMGLALKHAIVERDVGHLIFPDDVQNLPAVDDSPTVLPVGRVAEHGIAPPADEVARAVATLSAAERPTIILGNGARPHRTDILALAEHLDAPVMTTFKAKGSIPDAHPLACGVLGRSGTPTASAMMGRSDVLLVFGASFSNHTGISTNKTLIQVDFDRMTLGRFHSVDVPLWGEIGRTVEMLHSAVPSASRPQQRDAIARWTARWRSEKQRRAELLDGFGRMHPARLFATLSEVAPEDAILPVDVGNNTYAFGHYFETTGDQDVLMSGYLGSIGFALPAALGAWAATRGSRKIISISGDGGLGQYLAEFTTAVKYRMPITHIVLRNDELAKITREQVGALRPVFHTSLVNPDFAEFARSCGGHGFTVRQPGELEAALRASIEVDDGPSLVEVHTAGEWV
jgi:pyruvate oxidase